MEKESKQARDKEEKGDVFLESGDLKMEKLAMDLYREAMEFWEKRLKLNARDREESWTRLAVLYAKIGERLRYGDIWMDDKRKTLDAALYDKADALKAAVRSQKGVLGSIEFFYDIVDNYVGTGETFSKEKLQRQFQRLFNIYLWFDENGAVHNYNLSGYEIEIECFHKRNSATIWIDDWIEIGGEEYIVTRAIDFFDRINEEGSKAIWRVLDSDKKGYYLKLERIKSEEEKKRLYQECTHYDSQKDHKRYTLMDSGQLMDFRRRHNIDPSNESDILERLFHFLKNLWEVRFLGKEYWYY